MKPSDTSVVVCAYTEDRWDDLGAAVRSAQAQLPPPAEVLVVVDGNPALLERATGGLEGPTVLANREAAGLAGARNTGWQAASGRAVAFLDDDARARPGWLAALVGPLADPSVAGVGGAAEPAWDEPPPRWWPAEFNWVVGCSHPGLPAGRGRVRNPIGCNMSFRRDLLEDVGGFRCGMGRIGTVPVGCEETELCIRMAQRRPGSVFLYEPDATVDHRVPPERTTWRYFRRRCLGEGRSKAAVTALVGAADGLASERSYATAVVPRAVVRASADALRGDAGGLGRAGALVAGVGLAAAGYARGRLGGAR